MLLWCHGLDLAMGTVTGGLKKLVPLFDPIYAETIRKNLEQRQWHADETSWRVFVPVEGKVGWRWKLWVFQSASAVVFVLDPTREARVPETYFQDVEHGVLIVDRFSSYKAMLQVKNGRILLAFCGCMCVETFSGLPRIGRLIATGGWAGSTRSASSFISTIVGSRRLASNSPNVIRPCGKPSSR